MRILVAVNKQLYSVNAINQVATLAKSTWADVTLLGTEIKSEAPELKKGTLTGMEGLDMEMAKVLDGYRKQFVRMVGDKDSPYTPDHGDYHLKQDEKGTLTLDYNGRNGRKSLNARIRFGNAVKEILAESLEKDMDLILIVCGESGPCEWANHVNVPQKVAQNAKCSVFIVKEEKKPEMIVCCLDHDKVSQDSLELINQLVTLYQAELEIVGLKTGDALKSEVDHKMAEILNYYHDRNIRAWIRLVEANDLKSFISQAARDNLVALWMGKESFLDKFFPKKLLEEFVSTAGSSVLILR